jgi:hypothetical protein
MNCEARSLTRDDQVRDVRGDEDRRRLPDVLSRRVSSMRMLCSCLLSRGRMAAPGSSRFRCFSPLLAPNRLLLVLLRILDSGIVPLLLCECLLCLPPSWLSSGFFICPSLVISVEWAGYSCRARSGTEGMLPAVRCCSPTPFPYGAETLFPAFLLSFCVSVPQAIQIPRDEPDRTHGPCTT